MAKMTADRLAQTFQATNNRDGLQDMLLEAIIRLSVKEIAEVIVFSADRKVLSAALLALV